MRDPSKLPDFDWKEPGVIDELKRLHDDSFSGHEIAYRMMKKFGGILSRSAILGKLNRLGLSVPAKARPIKDALGAKKKRQRISALTGQGVVRFDSEFSSPILDVYTGPIKELSADDIPHAQRKQILDLKERDCRFPYGDVGTPEFFFCGGVTEKGRSYCGVHCRVAFQKPRSISDNVRLMTSVRNRKRDDPMGILSSDGERNNKILTVTHNE